MSRFLANYVCYDCDDKYRTQKQRDRGGAYTIREAICDLCDNRNAVLHVRHFNYLRELEKPVNQITES